MYDRRTSEADAFGHANGTTGTEDGTVSDYYDLGTCSRAVTTGSRQAQRWFDRGLAWTYGYNHEEAIACYRRALDADPECAMAWWGIAYAAGPNYNKPWEAFDEDDAQRSLRTAFDATGRAKELPGAATATEKALIHALRSRYPSPVPAADMCPWNDDYAAAMRTVHEDHGNDPDVAALFAEAIMNRTPWALWELESGAVAEGADTAEATAVLEAAIQRRDSRPPDSKKPWKRFPRAATCSTTGASTSWPLRGR